MHKATTADLKKVNTENVLKFIYRERKTTKLEIANQLQLSRPTISYCLKKLESMKLIEKNGYFESTGGRKAEAITFISASNIALGLEILKESFEIVAINLYGTVIKTEKISLPFKNDDRYFDEVCKTVNQFISLLHISPKRIIGLGIVLQGLISSDGTSVIYGKILNCTGLNIHSFSRYFPFPCRMIHDAEAAATIELWNNPSIKDAVFFHIRTNLSGALLIDGKFLKGNELKSGVFEHMTIIPGGKPCYCGKNGCVDCYCSYSALLSKDSTLEEYFKNLRAGESYARSIWLEYLEYMSIAIDNLHMFVDYDIILGGTLAVYLQPQDIKRLHQFVAERSAFPTKREFIKISNCATEPIAIGAALPYITKYFDTVLG